MKHKIKTVKEFIKNNSPQFDIILRGEPSQRDTITVVSGSEELPFEIRTTLSPPSKDKGIVKIVKRISDDKLFHQQDMVEVKDIGSCFIIEFKEDLIHCSVVCIVEQATIDVEIEYIEIHETVMFDGEL